MTVLLGCAGDGQPYFLLIFLKTIPYSPMIVACMFTGVSAKFHFYFKTGLMQIEQ